MVRTYSGASEVAFKPGISQKVGTTTTYSHPGLKNNEHQPQSASAISASRVYDAWGAVVSGAGAFQGRFGHGGAFGYQSDSTGLQLLGHRYYDPAVGRFLTPDPIKDGRNWFAYCENNPLTATDPSGLIAPIIVGGVLIVGAIVCSGCTGNDAVDTSASAVVPSPAGEVGGALEGGPTGAAAAIRLRERHRA